MSDNCQSCQEHEDDIRNWIKYATILKAEISALEKKIVELEKSSAIYVRKIVY